MSVDGLTRSKMANMLQKVLSCDTFCNKFA